jgi:alkylation response protein AidB-like acyl-CoA dehydrogenase
VTGVIVDELRARARTWLAAHAPRHRTGSDAWAARVAPLTAEQERAAVARARDFQAALFDAGLAGITWPRSCGGQGLTLLHQLAFDEEAESFELPSGYYFHVGHGMCGPTILAHGTPALQDRYLRPLLRGDEMWCQLFSEPGAGSDLASLRTRAVQDGDHWVVNGQKVWSSGAQFSEWGLLISRSDPDVPKHRGLTAFVIPMDLPGVTVRPIKQMSGGSSFNEVFFDDVRVADSMRLGDIGDGWKVALTTLGFERDHSDSGASGRRVGGSWRQALGTARAMGVTVDPVVRQRLARLYSHHRIEQLTNRRAADVRRAGQPAGPEGSLGKLLWTENMNLMSDVMSSVLGAGLIADIGDWGTYAWGAHVLGAPGYRIAGGSDEIQRNIIGERVLGLPVEPRLDKDTPWKNVPR